MACNQDWQDVTAALAAEREKCDARLARNDAINERDMQHEKQKRCAKYEDLISNQKRTIQQLREQLAARDLLVKQLEQDIEAKERQCDETYAELAALEGVLADDTGKAALDAAIAEATKPLVA